MFSGMFKNFQLSSHLEFNFRLFSGPQFGDIVMDQCQTDDKLGIDIKDEVGEKCEVHGKKQSNFILKLNFGAKNQHLDTLL